MKKLLALVLVFMLALGVLSACGTPAADQTEPPADDTTTPDDGGEVTSDVTIQFAALLNAYEDGTPGMWQQIADAFTEETGIKVELIVEMNLEDVIGAQMQGGDYPDVIHLATGRPAGLTEQFINDKNIAEITDVLSMTIPGEDVTVSDKLIEGFVNDSSGTNPYADGKTYLAPMFYSPCGLFYNAGLFEEKGWEVPTTWDEMWELGDKAMEEGIYLFTYPTTGYFDSFFPSLLYSAGGDEFFYDATHYAEGIWDTEEAQAVFDVLGKLATYTNPITPAQANNQDYTMNQQLILDNKALFIPNGNWLIGEMAEAPRAEGFEWGMTALPAITEGGDRYSYTYFEQMWIPAGAENIDAAKQFIAFMYSDKAVEIFAAAGAAQPVNGVVDMLTGDNVIFYNVYEDGAKAALGSFANFKAVAGMSATTPAEVFFDPFNNLVSGSLTIEDYAANIRAINDQLRENLA